jgi:hypothetical protein
MARVGGHDRAKTTYIMSSEAKRERGREWDPTISFKSMP